MQGDKGFHPTQSIMELPNPEKQISPPGEQDVFLDPQTLDAPHSDEKRRLEHVERDAALRSAIYLHSSYYIVVLVLGYSILALFAWVFTCILSHRPLGLKGYGVNLVDEYHGYGAWFYESFYKHWFVRSERLYRAAVIVQSIVSVLTIPLTSAVCTTAAVVFVQQHTTRGGLTLRQTMTLADRGWIDPATWTHLLSLQGWRKYGTSFLAIALSLNLLGGIIIPLQQIFLTSMTVRAPTWPEMMQNQVDIPDHFTGATDDGGLVTVLTRALLNTASMQDIQDQLWQGNRSNCADLIWNGPQPSECAIGGSTLANISILEEPFFAQLPTLFNTGLIRQFAPRINSSVLRSDIDQSEFTSNCQETPNSLFIQYASSPNVYSNWSMVACMPGNLTLSPWKNTRNRQDFSEELYLNITIQPSGNYPSELIGTSLTKIVVNTTAGFFELPNYMNQGLPGPLIEGDPSNYCGLDCEEQGYYFSSIHDRNISIRSAKRQSDSEIDTSGSFEGMANKGPLLTIALALFGEGSFIQERVAHPDAFLNTATTGAANLGDCMDLAPLQKLLDDDIGLNIGNSYSVINYCVKNDADSLKDIEDQIISYLLSFVSDTGNEEVNGKISNAFAAAAFLANKVWLTSPTSGIPSPPSLMISYDLGANIQVPVISETGIIVVSTLLGLFLLSLLILALYSALTPHWTKSLDAFTMMRIGASISSHLPMDVVGDVSKVEILDRTPGWVGDVSGGEGLVGVLGLGGTGALRRKRKYKKFERDREMRF